MGSGNNKEKMKLHRVYEVNSLKSKFFKGLFE